MHFEKPVLYHSDANISKKMNIHHPPYALDGAVLILFLIACFASLFENAVWPYTSQPSHESHNIFFDHKQNSRRSQVQREMTLLTVDQSAKLEPKSKRCLTVKLILGCRWAIVPAEALQHVTPAVSYSSFVSVIECIQRLYASSSKTTNEPPPCSKSCR